MRKSWPATETCFAASNCFRSLPSPPTLTRPRRSSSPKERFSTAFTRLLPASNQRRDSRECCQPPDSSRLSPERELHALVPGNPRPGSAGSLLLEGIVAVVGAVSGCGLDAAGPSSVPVDVWRVVRRGPGRHIAGTADRLGPGALRVPAQAAVRFADRPAVRAAHGSGGARVLEPVRRKGLARQISG